MHLTVDAIRFLRNVRGLMSVSTLSFMIADRSQNVLFVNSRKEGGDEAEDSLT